MWFFDITPLGRIVARFTQDIDKVDFMLAMTIQYALFGIMNTACAIVLISLITPYFLILCFVIVLIYMFLLRKYLPSGRDVKRIVDTIRGPLIGRFTEANMGLVTIRAFKKQDYFLTFFERVCDSHTRASLSEGWGQRWIGMIT